MSTKQLYFVLTGNAAFMLMPNVAQHKQRPSHGVDPVGVRLVGEGLQRRGPQLRIGKTRSEDVQVARISKKAHQLEAYPRIAGVGVHGRADAVGILFDERLDLVHQ